MRVKEIATMKHQKAAMATRGAPEKERDYTPTNL